jgi:hypothetical protein
MAAWVSGLEITLRVTGVTGPVMAGAPSGLAGVCWPPRLDSANRPRLIMPKP